jgi:GT2 family glycosyltransferase
MRSTRQESRNGSALSARDAPHPAPVVSVVIVTYQSADDILECLRSLRAAATALQIILIDNASRDATVQQLHAHPGLYDSLTCNQHNVGFARAVNQGIEQALGRYVLLLNPDSVLQPHAIDRVVNALDMCPDAAAAGCLLLNSDGTEQAGGRRSVPTPARALVRVMGLHRVFPGQRWARGFVLSEDPLPKGAVEVEATSGAFMMVRRAAIDQVGVLDEGYFMHCEDLDWCMRFRAQGWRVLFVPDARVLHKKGRSGRRQRIRVEWHKHKGMVRFYRKFFRARYPAPLMPLIVAAVWIRFALKAGMLGASAAAAIVSPRSVAGALRLPGAVEGQAAVGRFESRRP